MEKIYFLKKKIAQVSVVTLKPLAPLNSCACMFKNDFILCICNKYLSLMT